MTRDNFLKGLNNDSNHRMLLFEAINLSKGKIVEFGSGFDSTPWLTEHCKNKQRKFETYENNAEWAAKTGSTLISSWDDLNFDSIGVLFIDHAPGERRKVDLEKYKDIAQIIVIHDTEPVGAGDYRVRPLFSQFKYVVEVGTDGCWATMLSNYVDLSSTIGKTWDKYTIFQCTK